ncbi:MAG: phage portal protein [Gammaproteobacteria bacterium]|nr:phage portal protein [Gammaproteobacteria bacterium]
MPNLLSKIGRITKFGYNATEDKARRQSPARRVRHESLELPPVKRKKLNATAIDQLRNHSLMGWMYRKHLDYVSRFNISVGTGDDGLDNLVRRIFAWHALPQNFDISGRYGRKEMFRLFEGEKLSQGDAGLILDSGDLKLQTLESSLIYRGKGWEKKAEAKNKLNEDGVIVDDNGKILKFAVCKHSSATSATDPEFVRLEDAENVIFDAYWTRFGSQFRGISPMSSALNSVQDIAEGFEFNQLKAKLHALMGIALFRESNASGDLGGAAGATSETAGTDATADQTELDLNLRSLNLLDLAQDDKIELFESKAPSTEFVKGSMLFIQVAMLAFDIPMTCFDSRQSSFSARLADLNAYEKSNEWKRDKNKWKHQEYSNWILSELWKNGRGFQLADVATAAGLSLRGVQESVEWIPSASAWLDKFKQLQGDEKAIDIGADNIIDVCRRRGTDFYDNIEKQARAEEYAKAAGVSLIKGGSGTRSVEEIEAEEENGRDE